MKVIDKRGKATVPFKDVKDGVLFQYGTYLYIKAKRFMDPSQGNAVCLFDISGAAKICEIGPDLEVKVLNAELVIHPEV